MRYLEKIMAFPKDGRWNSGIFVGSLFDLPHGNWFPLPTLLASQSPTLWTTFKEACNSISKRTPVLEDRVSTVVCPDDHHTLILDWP